MPRLSSSSSSPSRWCVLAAALAAQSPAAAPGGAADQHRRTRRRREGPLARRPPRRRPRVGFEEGHIPGARFLRYADFAVDGDQSARLGVAAGRRGQAGLRGGRRVRQLARRHLRGSSPVIAARAFFTLDAMGHQHVALLDGGLRAWRDEKRPIETGRREAGDAQGSSRRA